MVRISIPTGNRWHAEESFNETAIHYNMSKVMENDKKWMHSRANNGKNLKLPAVLQGLLKRGATKLWKGNQNFFARQK